VAAVGGDGPIRRSLTCGVDLNMLYKRDVNDEIYIEIRGSGLYYG